MLPLCSSLTSRTSSHLSPYPGKLVAPEGFSHPLGTVAPVTILVDSWDNKNMQGFFGPIGNNVTILQVVPLNSQCGSPTTCRELLVKPSDPLGCNCWDHSHQMASSYGGPLGSLFIGMDALTWICATWRKPSLLAFLLGVASWLQMTLLPQVKMVSTPNTDFLCPEYWSPVPCYYRNGSH